MFRTGECNCSQVCLPSTAIVYLPLFCRWESEYQNYDSSSLPGFTALYCQEVVESSSDQERFAAAQPSAKPEAKANCSEFSPTCVRPVMNFMAMDVVRAGARDNRCFPAALCLLPLQGEKGGQPDTADCAAPSICHLSSATACCQLTEDPNLKWTVKG